MSKQVSQYARVWLPALALGLALALSGCGGGGDSNSGTPILGSAPQGSLGGTNIGLTVTAAGGTINLPCGSSGAITGPLTLDASGHFTASGTVTPISGPATTIGNEPPPYAAQFTGTTDGRTLHLTITPAASTGISASSYDLTYGAMPNFTALCPA